MHRICQIIHFHYTLDATYTQSVLVSGSLFVIYGVWYRCGDDAMACGCILYDVYFLFRFYFACFKNQLSHLRAFQARRGAEAKIPAE